MTVYVVRDGRVVELEKAGPPADAPQIQAANYEHVAQQFAPWDPDFPRVDRRGRGVFNSRRECEEWRAKFKHRTGVDPGRYNS